MPEEGPLGVLWEGGSCSGGVGPIPRSKDGMGDSLGNDCGVGERMSDLRHGCGMHGGMVGLRDGGGVGGKGSRVRTTRGVATNKRPVGAVLVLGLSVVLGL